MVLKIGLACQTEPIRNRKPLRPSDSFLVPVHQPLSPFLSFTIQNLALPSTKKNPRHLSSTTATARSGTLPPSIALRSFPLRPVRELQVSNPLFALTDSSFFLEVSSEFVVFRLLSRVLRLRLLPFNLFDMFFPNRALI
ncbi:uncharacterized protein DS421_19g653950 [Arachis hypogaea]|uniref:Uncharacterized protein n=1 Tax=Arachis hypogaea TaxID=3818 RepID=A0A6B9V818_ARAHY|nr:uncharacterized protein DS421_19g653950 [Arachis hypogaea]